MWHWSILIVELYTSLFLDTFSLTAENCCCTAWLDVKVIIGNNQLLQYPRHLADWCINMHVLCISSAECLNDHTTFVLSYNKAIVTTATSIQPRPS